MGLLQNISLLNAQPIRNMGGSAVQCVIRSSYNRPEQQMNMYFGLSGIDKKNGTPEGYSPPYSFIMPLRDGGMSSFGLVSGNGDVSIGILSGGKSLTIALTGSGRVIQDSSLSLLVRILASLTGAGEITDASQISLFMNMVATISASGEITPSSITSIAVCAAQITGAGLAEDNYLTTANSLTMSVALGLNGSGTISNASLTMLAQFMASLAGEGTISETDLKVIIGMATTILASGGIAASPLNVIAWCASVVIGAGQASGTMKGFADMGVNITSTGDLLTAQTVANAVWEALKVAHENPSTMGGALNASGGAADPWSTSLPGDYVAGQAGYIIGTELIAKIDSIIVNIAELHDYDDTTITGLINTLIKITGNKVTKSGDIITIYEENGTTVWRRYNLANGGRVLL